MAMLADPTSTLTARQLELLALYASGKELREIADIKFLSYVSVQKTLATAKARAGAMTLSHLVAMCIHAGVLIKYGDEFRPVQEERVVGE
jgi:DNA-binding CsgD family transcriptional regulator